MTVPTLTAIENVTLPADLARRVVDAAWLDQVISTIGLGDRLRHRPTPERVLDCMKRLGGAA